MIAEDLTRMAKRLALAFVCLVVMGMLASYCAARRVESAQRDAQQTAERDSSRARARRHEALAREHLVLANARAARADSVAKIAKRSALAADTHRALLVIDRATLPVAIQEQLRLDSLAIADSRLVAPAYHVAIESFRPAVETALLAVHESQRADTLSQALGTQRERAAHRRGVVQGIKGTLTTLAVAVLIGGALHLGGKF